MNLIIVLLTKLLWSNELRLLVEKFSLLHEIYLLNLPNKFVLVRLTKLFESIKHIFVEPTKHFNPKILLGQLNIFLSV